MDTLCHNCFYRFQHNQEKLFGENSGAGLVVVSTTIENLGQIIHVNCETEFMLGFMKNDLIGQNVNKIMPAIIGDQHNNFIKRYLDSAISRALDQQRQYFALTKEGYIIIVDLLIKIYPLINGKIIFVGLIQRSPDYKEIEHPKEELEHLPHHYIITDANGHIGNFTQSLTDAMGLHAKFCNKTTDGFSQMVKMDGFCHDIYKQEV